MRLAGAQSTRAAPPARTARRAPAGKHFRLNPTPSVFLSYSLPPVELDGFRRDMHTLEPFLELKAGQRPHARHRHISLSRFPRSPDIQIRGIERQALRLVNRHRPGQPQRKLRETRALGIVRIVAPCEWLDE